MRIRFDARMRFTASSIVLYFSRRWRFSNLVVESGVGKERASGHSTTSGVDTQNVLAGERHAQEIDERAALFCTQFLTLRACGQRFRSRRNERNNCSCSGDICTDQDDIEGVQ